MNKKAVDKSEVNERMNKDEFMKLLSARLGVMTSDEKQKALDYYDELFMDRCGNGEKEEDIIESFGDVGYIAERLLGDSGDSTSYMSQEEATCIASTSKRAVAKMQKVCSDGWDASVKVVKKSFSPLKNKTVLTVYISLCFITVPLTLAAIVVAFSLVLTAAAIVFSVVIAVLSVVLALAITVISFVIAFGVCGFAFLVAGPLYSVYGIYVATYNFGAGFAMIGCGLVLVALGVVFIMSLYSFNYLRILLFVKKNKQEKIATMSKKYKFGRCVSMMLIVAIVGASVFMIGFGNSDWDVHRLDAYTYKSASWSFDGEDIQEFKVKVYSRDVKIVRVTSDFRVQTNNYGNNKVTASFDGGRLTVREEYRFDLDQMFNIFSSTNLNKQKIVIYVPESAVRV